MPILTPEEERQVLGEPAEPIITPAEERQQTADDGFRRYLGRQDDAGDFDEFMAAHSDDAGSPGDMSADELRELLGGDADVMASSTTQSAPSAGQRQRDAYLGFERGGEAPPNPRDRWMAAYAATMEQMGVPQQYWRRERSGQPQVGNPYMTQQYQGQAPPPVQPVGYQGQAPPPVQPVGYQGQAPPPVQPVGYQGQAPPPVQPVGTYQRPGGR